MTEQQPPPNVSEQLTQLNTARSLVLQDAGFYPQIVTGIIPIVTPSTAAIELRRWGADFFAEAFSSPMLAPSEKLEMAVSCLDPLLTLISETQTGLLKSVIQCCASVYPLVFRQVCLNKADAATWEKMGAIKQRILPMLDTGAEGVRLACIKFVQRIIMVQTPGASDPRRLDKSEASLTLVPINHAVLKSQLLEAEAQGLLDRLLSVFQQPKLDPPIISATLNCLPTLVKTRATISNKVVNTLLQFNPYTQTKDRSFKARFAAKSMEKTLRTLLIHLIRAAPQGPNAQRLTQHVNRLLQSKNDFAAAAVATEETHRDLKRAAPADEDDDPSKRARMNNINNSNNNKPSQVIPPPMQISNGTTVAALYTLTNDQALSSFNVQDLPIDLVVQITLATIYSLDQAAMDTAIQAVRIRYNSLLQAAASIPPPPPPPIPTLAPAPQPVQSKNSTPETDGSEVQNANAALALDRINFGQGYSSSEDEDSYDPSRAIVRQSANPQSHLTQALVYSVPQSLTPDQLATATHSAVDRMFTSISTFPPPPPPSKREKTSGLTRLAATNWDQNGWITVLSRLSTRALTTLEDAEIVLEQEENMHVPKLSTFIREKIFTYVTQDFRGRMDTAIAWLNEEWYNDQLMTNTPAYEPQYVKWMTKTLDGIIPYLESTDKIFLRFLSEVPEIPRDVLERGLRMLCLDPERSSLGFLALQYLTMLKPPLRGACLDIVEDLWRNHDDVKTAAKKLLIKYRPEALEEDKPVVPIMKEEVMEDAEQENKTAVAA